MATPDTILQTQGLTSIKSENILITPTGGVQTTLGDALAAGGGSSGPIAATTLSASGAVTLSPANANLLMGPTGTGTHSIDNMTMGLTIPLAGKYTTIVATTSVTTPVLTVTGNATFDATKCGFYGKAAIVQQTGVAVSDAAIHAALVNLGLITA